MAITIKDIPTLKGEVAEEFISRTEKSSKKQRASVEFREHVKTAGAILKKSKI